MSTASSLDFFYESTDNVYVINFDRSITAQKHTSFEIRKKLEMFDSIHNLLSHIYVDRNYQHIDCTGTISRNKHILRFKCVEGITGGLGK